MAITTSVNVVFEEDPRVPQQNTFRCCPLGLQFFSPRKHADGTFLQISFAHPGGTQEDEALQCEGMVVYSEREEDSPLYRHWVFFLDLPESVRKELQCLTDDMESRCPWCENF